MAVHEIVSPEEWLDARREHLVKEKELTRLRDELSQERRDLPWVKINKEYVFEGTEGRESLSDLFDGRRQLLVYHFMFDPAWDEGCKVCSWFADHYSGTAIHLKHRDVSMVTVSRAPLEKLHAYRKRMGWDIKWVSSSGSDFNYDYHVSCTVEEQEKGEVFYNFQKSKFVSAESPGISAFYKDDGSIYHTYSSYARGLDILIGSYNLLDLVPMGRNESDLPFTMAWINYRDKYDD